ncbi:hypothetical protein E4U43_001601 [Claviceps pusilla]|uniref:Uncharacterized protein n=1 Tax=Claviceps pusilla TaxID=123648 RepID=A0A9P7N7J7_9HYPO|nr:hypothetical protein E4U43_001601 [Claviceps pusilla]
MHPTMPLQFEFVIGSRPEHLETDSSRRLQGHRALLPVLTSSSSAGNKGVDPAHADAQGQGQRGCDGNGSGEGRGRGGEPEPESEPVRKAAWRLGQCLSMDAYFGGIRVDPFRSYPGTWQPYIPALADDYIIQMVRDIPEVDQPGNKGLLRSRWFPLVLSDAAPFHVVMLLSAADYASVHNIRGLGCHILHMKHEAMHGDVASYRMHMDGLERMLAARGGLARLDLGGSRAG